VFDVTITQEVASVGWFRHCSPGECVLAKIEAKADFVLPLGETGALK
jgi:hypothetical protein